MEFNTDLITALHLGIVYPAAILGIVLSIAQGAPPDLTVLVVTRRIRSGPASLSAVRERFRFWSKDTSTRQGLLIWAQMTATFIALSLATAGLDHLWLSSEEYSWHAPSLTGGLIAGLAVAMFLDAGALLEENGWRGYALPLLLLRHSPVKASVIPGLGWAAWHYPVKYNAITDYGVGGIAYLAAFTVKIVLLTLSSPTSGNAPARQPSSRSRCTACPTTPCVCRAISSATACASPSSVSSPSRCPSRSSRPSWSGRRVGGWVPLELPR